jgi:hypothetical protein
MKIYKYIGPDTINKVFATPKVCTVRCSYPKDFNDPYELFLAIDYNQEADVLAYYREVIGEIPQLATTCFSKSPSVVPMWAHYAQNHEGIVLEIDEDKLREALPDITSEDVDYMDAPDGRILRLLNQAYTTCKPRHVYFLQRAVFGASYFSKHSCWAYEQERRIIVPPKYIDEINGLLLFNVPVESITSIAIGFKANQETKEVAQKTAAHYNLPYLEMRIGRASTQPYFADAAKNLWVFRDGEIVAQTDRCATCSEPVQNGAKRCPWCSIHEIDAFNAARNNPMRLLSRYGLLDAYYEDMEKIRRQQRE